MIIPNLVPADPIIHIELPEPSSNHDNNENESEELEESTAYRNCSKYKCCLTL